MNDQGPATTTVVCLGGAAQAVRSVCARVRKSGYHAIGIITDVGPDCTLSLLTALSPDAILVSDDLPGTTAATFGAILERLYPDSRILLMKEGPPRGKPCLRGRGSHSPQDAMLRKLSVLFQAIV